MDKEGIYWTFPPYLFLTRYTIICEFSHDFWDDIIALWEFKDNHQLGLYQCALLVLLNLSIAYGDGQLVFINVKD